MNCKILVILKMHLFSDMFDFDYRQGHKTLPRMIPRPEIPVSQIQIKMDFEKVIWVLGFLLLIATILMGVYILYANIAYRLTL